MNKEYHTNGIKRQNRQFIYNFIRKNANVSKHDIVIGLRLSLPTVTQNINILEEENLIYPSKTKKTGGRDAATYSYKQNGRYAIGIYPTGNRLIGVCVDLSGDVVYTRKENIKFNLDDQNYLKRIGRLVDDIVEEKQLSNDILIGVGIALPGLISYDGEQVKHGLTYNFTGKTREYISNYISYPNKIFHDSYAAGFAEVWINKDLQHAVYISINHSIGGAIIINRSLYLGDNLCSGEIGHINLLPSGGKLCFCGKHGCFDTVCNAGVLDSYTNGDLEAFFNLLDKNDKGAIKIWQQYLDYLATTINNVRMLFDCTIIIGGYVGAWIEDYMDELYDKVDERNCFKDSSRDYLKPCIYKTEVTAAGAAIHLIDDFINNIEI